MRRDPCCSRARELKTVSAPRTVNLEAVGRSRRLVWEIRKFRMARVQMWGEIQVVGRGHRVGSSDSASVLDRASVTPSILNFAIARDGMVIR